MGHWGVLPFENDDAADWISELADEADVTSILDAHDDALGTLGITLLDVTDCSIAIAAGELLAQIVQADPIFDEVDRVLVDELRRQFQGLSLAGQCAAVARAIDAIEYIAFEEDLSELAQVWSQDRDRFAEWLSATTKLVERLKQGFSSVA
jgi:hypothetical protein